MAFKTWLVVPIWLLWLGVAVQCGLAVHAFLVERREGMRSSSMRVYLLGGVFLFSSILVLAAMFLPPQTSPPATVPVPAGPANISNPELDQKQKELAQVRNQLDQIEKQRVPLLQSADTLQNQINALSGTKRHSGPVQSIERMDWSTRASIVLTVLACLLIAGFVILAMGGRLQTLLPPGLSAWINRRSQDDEALQRDLDSLTALVTAEKYSEALEKAAAIPEKKLKMLDQLDFWFLRAFACVELAAFPKPEDTREARRKLLDSAILDLEAVIAEAPKRVEAVYTLGIAYGLTDKHAEALACFERSREPLRGAKNLPFDHNESVCLLRLAETSLNDTNTEKAEGYYSRVAKLGKLADSVVISRIRIAMIDLRSAMNRQDMAAASATLERITGLRNLNDEQKAQIDVICSALNARIALRRDNPDLVLQEASNFLTKYLPGGLPPLDDETADESFSPVLDDDLPFPREVVQGFLFIQSVALSRAIGKSRVKPTEAQITTLAEPVLRGLQFVPRHRDLLAAIGGLYYWFRREKRAKAREWLEAAVTMGSRGRIARAILERDRMIETERREGLDWFRSASSRFLRDPALASDIRRALVEELGRFQEFEPMLISLREKPELEPEEPTMQGLRERAAYLADLLARMAHQKQSEKFAKIAQIHKEYSGYLAHLEQTTQAISELERRVFTELAESLALGA